MANYFVFDLDDTVVSAITYDIENGEKAIDEVFGKEFRFKMREEVLKYPHMVFPGFDALFRWLYEAGDNYIYFFSSGTKERNETLVPKLIKRAFPEKTDEVMTKVKVFSRDDCVDTTILAREDSEKYQSHFYGQRKKKLGGIVVDESELSSALLIEDDQSYMTLGEEYNLVKVRSGYRFLPDFKYVDEFHKFHKAYYLCGIFNDMFEMVKEQGKTLVEAAKCIQVDRENKVLDRDFYYSSIENIKYYEDGLKILQKIDPELKFYFELPNKDDI